MTDSTDVDPDALLAFGSTLFGMYQEYGQSMREPHSTAISAFIGTSGMQEAAWASSSFEAACDAAGQFLADTLNGLQALAYVAGQVAATYHEGDADQADQLATVAAAFDPPPGQASTASRRAEDEAAAAAAAGSSDREEARFRNQVDAAGRVDVLPPQLVVGPTGASTVGDGPASDRYSRYADEVATHRAFVAGGGRGGSAEDEYDPRGEYDAAVDEAADRSTRDHIPYVVLVDDHGTSTVVQADPDDVPRPDAVDYTDARPGGATTYSAYAGAGG